MLNENIRLFRKAKGLSQEALAARLNVVRQTVSKWEQGLSVPDADLLIALSEALETPVSALLGETAAPPQADDLTVLSAKLEEINFQLAKRKAAKRAVLHWLFLALCGVVLVIFAVLIHYGSPYLGWEASDPESAVVKTALHGAEWLFVRLGPVIFAGSAAGAFLTRKKR